jgi:glycosyltransferase involved in cell wall biosynthesis
MAETLAGAGYGVDLLAFPFGEDVSIEGCELIRSPRVPGINSVPIGPSWAKIVLDFPFTMHALFLVCSRRYHAVHGIEEAGCIAGLLGLLTRVPYVYDMDSCIPTQLRESGFIKSNTLLNFVEKIESFFIKRSAAVLTVCSALTKKAQAKALNHSKVFQIEDFPYEPATRFSMDIVEKLKQEFALQGRSVVLYTGNLEQYQGIDLLIESFARLPATLPAVLLIVGGNQDTVENYKQKADELGCSERIILSGNRPAQEMGAFMSASDVLVSPRIEGENTPLKIYSYMAAERAIVATNILSHSQVLDDSVAFLPEPNADSFSESLLRALTSSEESSSRVRAAKELVDSRYSFSEFKRRLLEMYSVIFKTTSSKFVNDSSADDSEGVESSNPEKSVADKKNTQSADQRYANAE